MSDQNTTPASAQTNAGEVKPAETTPAQAAPPSTEAKPATETQPAETKPAQETKPAEVKPPVVPEKYDLKLPEGSLLDAARVEKIASFAKERGLSNEQAQIIVDREHDAVASFFEGQKSMLAQKSEEWRQAVETDKELGGEKFKENVEMAHRVLKRYGSEAFMKELEVTGFGNHPEVVRVFNKIGRAMSEDQLVMPNSQGGGRARTMEDVFYPNQNKE